MSNVFNCDSRDLTHLLSEVHGQFIQFAKNWMALCTCSADNGVYLVKQFLNILGAVYFVVHIFESLDKSLTQQYN